MARLDKLSDQGIRTLLNAFSPAAPTELKAVGGDGSATLSWVSPVTVSQLPVTDHQVEYSADGTNWTTFYDAAGGAPTAVVTGLTNGSSYFFRVRSVNRAGFGPYASTTASTLIGLPPGEPTSLVATAGERQVQLSWVAPASNGGLAISNYGIEYSIDSGATWTAVARQSASTAVSFTVTGLAGQISHQFRVRAINGIGPGAWSTTATATPVTYDDYWDDVSLLLKMEGNGTSFVDSSPNNTAITSAGATQSTSQRKWGSKSADLPASSNYLSVASGASTALTGAFTVEFWVYFKTTPTREMFLFYGANNRTEGQTMSFLVTSANGQGLRYGRSWVGYLGDPAPAQFQAARWYHIAVVREADFRIRLFVDGVQINSVMPVDVFGGSSSLSGRLFVGYPGRSANAFIDELRITKRARYSANFAPLTEPFPTAKRPLAPAAPATVTATAGDGQLSVAWSSVAGAASYIVEYQQDSGVWEAGGTATATSRTITGLVNGQTYTVRVAAVNVVGQSVWVTSAPVTLFIPPAQVSNLTASAGHLQACLSWTAPDGDVTDYIVQYSANSGSTWTTFAHPASTATSITVTGLSNGVSYQFRVAATNAQSTGSYSSVATATPSLVLPEAPTGVAGTSGNAQVALAWTAPSNTSCRALTNYIISYSANSGTSWTTLSPQPATSSSATVPGLTNGVSYIFRVAYQSAAGTGPWSPPSQAITPSGPPSPPVSVSGTAGDGQVAVAWVAGDNGGSPVLDYLLQYSTDQTSWTQIDDGQNTSGSYTVTGLTNGTAYYFRVSARTAFGDSVPTQSAAVTPRGVPGTPGTPSGTAASGQVSLTWTPASANGSAVTGYTVEYTPSGGVSQTIATGVSTASYTLAGLTNGVSYTFRVRATNAAGVSQWSDSTASILVQGVPGVPAGFGGTTNNGSVLLVWTAPVDNGGSAITNYTVEYTPAGGSAVTATASSSPYTLSGLTNGTAYSIRVAANNSNGRGAYTTAISRTPATTPGTPTGLTAPRGSASGRLALSWTAPSNGGSAITGYTVEYTPAGGSAQTVNTGTATASYNLDGLTNGTVYTVRVRALNAAGAGSYSTVATNSPGFTPGVPTLLSGTVGNGNVSLSWTAPADNGGFAITNYTVEYTPAGGSAVTATASSSPYTLTGLANGTAYSIRVAANNLIGRGPYTTAISRTPATTPGTPTGLTATGGTADGRLVLSWTAPSDGGSAITNHTVEYTPDGGAAQAINTSSGATTYNLDGLTNGTSYSVRVQAVNVVGAGNYSTAATGTPFWVPSAPRFLTGAPGDGQVELDWEVPFSDGSESIDDYVVQYRESSSSFWATWNDGTSSIYTSTRVMLLTNGTPYYFRVAAVNNAGTGPWATIGPITPVAPTYIDYLIVSGGGGGGCCRGAGGGAGGVKIGSSTLAPSRFCTVIVGGGGAYVDDGADGAASTLDADSFQSVIGGGGGATGIAAWRFGQGRNGRTGASGGGGSGASPVGYGGAGTAGIGSDGARGVGFAEPYGGGGGGGAGGAAPTQNPLFPEYEWDRRPGGPGTAIANAWLAAFSIGDISGGLRYIGGGGGGGGYNSYSDETPGGIGGGGFGGVNPKEGFAVGGNGTANLGGGGGGGANGLGGGNGGSGLVMIRYNAALPAATSTTGSPQTVVSGNYRYYLWTGSGSITL